MKQILKSCYINDKKKDGTPFIDKTGTPYKMCSIEIQADQNRYSLFLGQKYGAKDYEVVSQWQPGMEVDIITERNGDYWNFKLPNQTDKLSERINSLENLVRQICVLNGLKTKSGTTYQNQTENASGDQFGALHEAIEDSSQEISISDIPF